jgi:hypothetical protein
MVGSKNNSVWLAKLDYRQNEFTVSQLFSITKLVLAAEIAIIAALAIIIVRYKIRKKV